MFVDEEEEEIESADVCLYETIMTRAANLPRDINAPVHPTSFSFFTVQFFFLFTQLHSKPLLYPMLSSSSTSRRLGTQLQQVRYNRSPAYPRYKAPAVPVTHPKKDHTGLLRRQFLAWLGPKNMRGEYFRNKYFYPPQDHKPNYIVPNGQSLVDPSQPEHARSFGNDGRNPAVHPFPANPACKTASVISDSLKETIYERVVINGESSQQLANDYKIKMARIEAIVQLQKIEKQYQEQVCI